MKIKTNRLVIRNLSFNDDFDLFEMCSDYQTAKDAGWKPHESINVTRNVLAAHIYSNETFAITLKDTTFIGTISLYDNKNREVVSRELGFCLNKKFRNNGYITEAINGVINEVFSKNEIKLLTICHADFNIACEKVISKTNFQYEGLLRGYRVLFDNTVCNCKFYSMNKEEYLGGN